MDPAFAAAIEQMQEYVRTAFASSGSHGFDHVLRVTRLCEVLGAEEGADMRVLLPAALFHDIARPLEEERGIPHEEEGARMAEAYLTPTGYDRSLIPAIAHAIRAHRYRSGPRPETLEAMVLSDADKLDAMGAVGIARTFMQAGEQGREIGDAEDHIHEKLLRLKDRMYTDAGRELAKKRHELLLAFAEALDEETNIPG
jgi:uncharacterized protein